jgi:hypothetical protein
LWHYDDVPEYATADFEDRHENHVSYMTIVSDCLMGLPPERIKVGGDVWERVNYFTSSGETECPCAQCDEDPFAGKVCPLCERSADATEHEYVYLGDGWAEVIYRHVDKARLAEDHNIELWVDTVTTCNSCGATTPHTHWRDSLEHEGNCADERDPNVTGPRVTHGTNAKWWWWSCSPGCLPESEPMGLSAKTKVRFPGAHVTAAIRISAARDTSVTDTIRRRRKCRSTITFVRIVSITRHTVNWTTKQCRQ